MPLSAHFLSTEEDRGQIGAARHVRGGGERQRNEDGRVRDRGAPLADGGCTFRHMQTVNVGARWRGVQAPGWTVGERTDRRFLRLTSLLLL